MYLKDKVKKIYRKCRRKLFLLSHFNGIDKNITIISNNCIAGMIYKNIGGGLYKSPTIWTLIPPDDFIKFCTSLDYYLSLPIKESEIFQFDYGNMYPGEVCNFPCGVIGDVKIIFPHCKTFDEAIEKWNRRLTRINKNKIFVVLYAYDNYLNDKLFFDFGKIPYKKIILTSHHLPNKSDYYSLNIEPPLQWWNTLHQIKAYWELFNWKKFLR